MKTGEAAHLLSVDPKTVINWINNEHFKKFFSASAKKEAGLKQRLLTDDDVILLNTIRHESADTKMTWADIALVIESGNLYRDIPQNAGYTDTRMVPEPQAREFAKAAATLAERDQLTILLEELKAQTTKLEQRLVQEQDARRADIDKYVREIGDVRAEKDAELRKLNAELVEAQTMLKLYESGRLAPPLAK